MYVFFSLLLNVLQIGVLHLKITEKAEMANIKTLLVKIKIFESFSR